MHLRRTGLFSFRNYDEKEFTFTAGANALTGPNGSGKTNTLDAIHYLCLCKSYFQSSDSANIKTGSSFFTVTGEFELNGHQEDIIVTVKTGSKKTVKRNQKEYQRLGEHIGLLPLVMVAPLDQELITGPSEERRRLTDSIICQYDHAYLDQLVAYNKVLQQRNAFLRQLHRHSEPDESLMQVWNDQLSAYGTLIHAARKIFAEKYTPLVNEYYSWLTDKAEHVSVEYISQLNESTMEQILSSNLRRDLSVQYTSGGIHRDDLELLLNGQSVKRIGSQGQQKSFVLALKLAQFELMRQYNGSKPLLLLDDIFDKLDQQRITRLMALVSKETFGQIFITDTNSEHVQAVFDSINVPLNLIHCDY